MEKLQGVFGVIAVFALCAASFVPDMIAGVNKAMRMGKVDYPKEKKKEKWKWVGIFFGIAAVAFGLSCLTYSIA